MENEQCFRGIPNANANVEYRTGLQRSPSRILKKDVDQALETPAGSSKNFSMHDIEKTSLHATLSRNFN